MPAQATATEFAHPGVRRAGLWFGLIGGGLAWALHLITAYAIAEFGCVGRLAERSYASISLVAWLEILLTVITTLIAGAATAIAFQCQRRLQSVDSTERFPIADVFTARAGLFASGIFTFVILFESIPILFYLRNC
jgi:hypothetical protein